MTPRKKKQTNKQTEGWSPRSASLFSIRVEGLCSGFQIKCVHGTFSRYIALTITYTSRKRKLTCINRVTVVQKKLSVPCDTVKSRNGKGKLDENHNIHVQPKKMKSVAIAASSIS